MTSSLDYVHADVFTAEPFSGNSLAVFPDASGLDHGQMLRITQELRHFESIFITSTGAPRTVAAHVFDLVEELPFAGHPLIGAAAVLQHRVAPGQGGQWRFQLGERVVPVDVAPAGAVYRARLDQGRPAPFIPVIARDEVAAAYSLRPEDLHPSLPLEIGDTGLRYLVVPVAPGAIGRARIVRDITDLLRGHGAQFGVLFDPEALEQRHWNNDGIVEDVATGSAAGVVAAYARRHGIVPISTPVALRQGRWVGRPSVLTIRAEGPSDDIAAVHVEGDVALVGVGTLWSRPPAGQPTPLGTGHAR